MPNSSVYRLLFLDLTILLKAGRLTETEYKLALSDIAQQLNLINYKVL